MSLSLHSTFRALIVISVITLLAGVSFEVGTVNGQSAPSCPASETLGVSFLGGLPNSFNHLTANPAGGFGYYLMYYTLFPLYNPSGQPDYTRSILSWGRSNSNYTVWDFNVKPNLKWSDGTTVTASDILRTYSSSFALNKSYALNNAYLEVQSAHQVNSSEAEFALNTPDAHFEERLSDPLYTGVYPSSFTSKGPGFSGFGVTDAAAGVFYSVNYTEGSSQAVFLRNQYSNPLSKACELIVNFPETISLTPNLLLSGTADLAPVAPADLAGVLAHPNLHLASVPYHELTYLRYNVTSYPFNETSFRQALAFGINQSAIIQTAFDGYGSTAYTAEGITPSSVPWYSPSQTQYSYSPTTAASLLSSIGLAKGGDGLLHYSNGTAVTFKLFTDTNFVYDPVVAQLIKNDLQQLGITINIVTEGLGPMIGGSFANANDEQHNIIMWTTPGPDFGSPFTNSQPGYAANIVAMVPGSTWEYPPSAENNFNGNETTLDTTPSGTTAFNAAVANVQDINAKYLPILPLAYPDELWVYSTARWTNWPSSAGTGNYLVTAAALNETTLANLTPVSSSSMTSTASSMTSTASSMTSTTTTAAPTGDNTYLYVVGIVVVLVIIAAAVAFSRRKPKPTPT